LDRTDGEFFCINDSGNVGIGTSSPTTLLQVAGTTSFYNGAASTGAISAGHKETITTGFNLGAGESVDISTISITSSTTWKAILVGGYANNIEGGGLVSPSLEIELDNGSATVAVGGVNVTFSRNASTGKLQATNSSGSGRGTFVGTIEVINFPQSLVPTTSKIIRGNVGIGTGAPTAKLQVEAASGSPTITLSRLASGVSYELGNFSNSGSDLFFNGTANIFINADSNGDSTGADRNVIIGNRGVEYARFTTSGLTFNGDTAAANALDDYEEGTFTATLSPSDSGSISLSAATCTYTKIGRQVVVKGLIAISSVSTPVGASVTIGGLPFTIINSTAGRGSFSVVILDASASYTAATYPTQHTLNATSLIVYVNASTIEPNDEIMFTATYFV
jgi:hypothetical protein